MKSPEDQTSESNLSAAFSLDNALYLGRCRYCGFKVFGNGDSATFHEPESGADQACGENPQIGHARCECLIDNNRTWLDPGAGDECGGTITNGFCDACGWNVLAEGGAA